MVAVALAEAKARLSELIRLAEQGEAVTITSRGKPVADIVPRKQPKRPFDPEELRRIRAMSKPWEGEGSFVVWAKEQDLL
ncbi:type II toxin-antitoxin system Phd/YefM family antitoxin [Sphingomonas sp.]|uniref:type II toxin-antitoxin system Phd/YefM family antitoxin n=1 Tax=Sphingomonas sp. TaxID=28214 RepID=UPI003CC508DC